MSDSNNLEWLQRWYVDQCDGDWEHQYGVHITTIDNPGWMIDIDLSGTASAELIHEPIKDEPNEDDWMHVWIADGKLRGACSPSRLDEVLSTFRTWIAAW